MWFTVITTPIDNPNPKIFVSNSVLRQICCRISMAPMGSFRYCLSGIAVNLQDLIRVVCHAKMSVWSGVELWSNCSACSKVD
ncbi:unnamed protein product [Sphagnum troendelagicum]|uniref:Uncharacterized protein n=1 Tax=Sphagnum troendelagicum TaxID=128251 RepID=A0ABP0U0X6_9BRYO